MGANNGTGWPMFFKCPRCRRAGRKTSAHNVTLTGKTRPYKGGNRGIRGSDTHRQYQCTLCQHVGWSRHIDLERIA